MDIKKLSKDLPTAFTFLAVLVTSTLFTEALQRIIFRWGMVNNYILLIGSLVFYLLSAFFALSITRDIFRLNPIKKQEKVEPHQVMIMTLSKSNFAVSESEGRLTITKNKVDSTVDLTDDLENDIKNLEHTNLQQLLRAIAPHRMELAKVILLGSIGGSDSSLDDVRKILRYYIDGVVVLNKTVGSFEDLDMLDTAFEAAVKDSKAQDKDIIIDVTGGTKTASIAAAVFALKKRDLEFQYVQTEKPYAVLAFNMVAETFGKLGT